MSPATRVGAVIAALAISASATAQSAAAASPAPAPPADSGVVRVESSYGMDETLVRLKQDIAAKGLRLFDEIDQAQLAAAAGVTLKPSVLLLFGNPPLGVQFLTANPYSGLDWPVRMVVFEDESGQVWMAYTDFDFIARRYHITDRALQLEMARQYAASIASSASASAKP